MHESLRYFLEKILLKYSDKDFYDRLLAAKEFYFQKTGKVFEEDEDYESRMAAFNDWYVLEYKIENDSTCFDKFCSENKTTPEIVTAIKGTVHSLYEYTGTSFKGLHVLKDILHDEKVTLAKNHSAPSLLKGDMFIGRVVNYLEENYLYNGLRVMPKDAASILKKEVKKVRKVYKKVAEGEEKEKLQSLLESKFLFLAESHKTKWQHYGHVNVEKIFVFPKEYQEQTV